MSLFGRRNDPQEEQAERAHQAIEDADAHLAAAEMRSRDARSSAFELAEAEVYSGQAHVNAARAHADQQLAQAVDDADLAAYRTIHRANEKAESRKEAARQKAAAGVSKAEEAAAQRRDVEMTRAAQLRDHANYATPPPGATG